MKLLERAGAIAGDHDAGASELTAQLLSLLSDAIRAGERAPLEVTRIVLAGQPAMAPLWHACAAALAERDRPGTFEHRRAEMERAPRALTRAARFALRDLLADDPSPLVLTLSYSSSIARVMVEFARSTPLRVACGEGRPRFEGRRLATTLAHAGIDVTVVIDAALTALLAEASAVVMGADAVTADSWINKVGSTGLAAAASLRAVPVYVIAGRDKFVPQRLAPRLVSPAPDPHEVWPDPPAMVAVRNLYFETVPAELATLVLTEAGGLAPPDLRFVTERHARDLASLLAALL